jgi:MFS family permease
VAFSAAAAGAGLGRALVTTYLPVLLERIRDAPGRIGTVMLVNTAAGLVVPLVIGASSDRMRTRGHGRTLPLVLGGALVTAGGLTAIALGHATRVPRDDATVEAHGRQPPSSFIVVATTDEGPNLHRMPASSPGGTMAPDRSRTHP